MTISKEQQAQILRFHHAEKWRVGTIARQLGLHHARADRVVSQAGLSPSGAGARRGRGDRPPCAQL
jgi:hypothetical protein